MYRDHKHFTACQKQYRHNDPAGQVDIPTSVQVCVMGEPNMYRDQKHFTACQKQYSQNEPAGQEDIPTGVEICVMGDPGHV